MNRGWTNERVVILWETSGYKKIIPNVLKTCSSRSKGKARTWYALIFQKIVAICNIFKGMGSCCKDGFFLHLYGNWVTTIFADTHSNPDILIIDSTHAKSWHT